MREINLDELRERQIKILDFVDDFCRKNKINYWIDCGTLLGAVRHKGYIPWDDDIDIGMLREDYDKFIVMFMNNDSQYQLRCCEYDKNHVYAYGKVCDTKTVLFEPDENGIETAINIDVFVYDNAPNSKRKMREMHFWRDYYQMMTGMRLFNYTPRGGIIRRSAIQLMRSILRPFISKRDLNYYAIQKVNNAKKYSKDECLYVGNFTANSRIFSSKKIFDDFIEVEFEGKKYMAPKGFDEWLKGFYGNYMELPPLDKQVSTHRFKAFVYDENDK